MSTISPFQTIGPYFEVMLRTAPRGTGSLVADGVRGQRLTIEGVVYDGANTSVTDGLVEIWQADAEGRYRHPRDPRHTDADPAFAGYGRAATDDDGRFQFTTVRPGVVSGPDDQAQAPHVLVSVMARGILTRYITRMYFEDESRNAADPILQLVPEGRRATLFARPTGEGRYRFDIYIQGPHETVFFDA